MLSQSLALWADGFWTPIFHLNLPVLEKIVRPIFVYAFLVLLLRVFGKRELAQLNPFDLVVLLSLSNTVQNAIIGDDNSLTGGLVGAFSLCAVNYVVIRFLFRHRRLDQLIEGKPTPLIEKGRVSKANLAREMITHSELLTIAHRQGFATLDDIDSCTLEPGGTFAIEGKGTPARASAPRRGPQATRRGPEPTRSDRAEVGISGEEFGERDAVIGDRDGSTVGRPQFLRRVDPERGVDRGVEVGGRRRGARRSSCRGRRSSPRPDPPSSRHPRAGR